MARKKRKKKKSQKRRAFHMRENDASVHTSTFEITSEPLPEPAYDRLPASVRKRLDEIHARIPRHPEQVIPELLELKEKYPDVPQIYNYLAVAYSHQGDKEKAEAITAENLKRNPDYLFARINMAQFYLARGEYDRIPELFDNKFDLKLLYPRKKRFHISEAANFFGVMGLYFAKTNQREAAEVYYEMLKELAPHFPITRQLSRELHPGIFARLFGAKHRSAS